MSLKLLLVEDSPHKRLKIAEHLDSIPFAIELITACSFNSACRNLDEHNFDLLVLDLSLPTYDTKDGASGGRFRVFGGREVARKALRRSSQTHFLFITQYQAFTDGGRSYTFSDIEGALRSDCGDKFVGIIAFDSSTVEWKDELTRTISMLKNENPNS